jgi:hypothetical protein
VNLSSERITIEYIERQVFVTEDLKNVMAVTNLNISNSRLESITMIPSMLLSMFPQMLLSMLFPML